MRDSCDQSWIGEGSGIDCDFVGSGVKHSRGIVQRSNTTTHGKRDKQLPGGALDHIKQGGAMFVSRGNIQQHNFVSSGTTMSQCKFGRISSIAQVRELNALDHTS